MTPQQQLFVIAARRQIRELGQKWIADGNPAGAFTEALRTVEGFGLHWGAGGGAQPRKRPFGTRHTRKRQSRPHGPLRGCGRLTG